MRRAVGYTINKGERRREYWETGYVQMEMREDGGTNERGNTGPILLESVHGTATISTPAGRADDDDSIDDEDESISGSGAETCMLRQ
nr:hypothetical protein CFP56_57022 [Quercus suber]